MPTSRTPKRRSDRGVALILTLLVLSILVVVVVQFSYAVKVEKTIVQNGLEDQQLMLAARGVIPYLGTLFRDDAKDPNPSIKGADGLCDNYDDPNVADKLHKLKIGDVDIELRVEDLDRRFPLEWLADDRRATFALTTLQRLLAKLKVENPEDVATKIANKVRELAGKEALAAPQPGGAVQPPTPPVAPPPAPQPGQPEPPQKRFVFAIEQLLDVEGVDKMDEILYGDPKAQPPKLGLADFVTCWPTSNININTCRAEVMVAVLPTQTKVVAAPGSSATPAPQPIDVEALAKKIRAKRIDPLYESEASNPAAGSGTPAPPPPPPPPPPPAGGTGGTGSGASKSWSSSSKSFEQLTELGQFEELKGYFPQGTAGTPGAPPPPPPPPPGPGTAALPFDFTQALATTSRFYAVHVKATAASGNTKVVRLVVARNKQNLVSPLLVREEPK